MCREKRQCLGPIDEMPWCTQSIIQRNKLGASPRYVHERFHWFDQRESKFIEKIQTASIFNLLSEDLSIENRNRNRK